MIKLFKSCLISYRNTCSLFQLMHLVTEGGLLTKYETQSNRSVFLASSTASKKFLFCLTEKPFTNVKVV